MRASTLFAITIAILLGLAAAVTVKITGYLNTPAPTVAAKLPEINVLVAARTLYKGNLIDNGWVTVRPLRADELKDYEQNKDKYLPAVPNAAVLRISAQNIETDTPLLKEHLVPIADTTPTSISMRLLPNMRAITLPITKDHSVGGLIQEGEWVDVYLTSQISVEGVASTRTAPIAHKQRVIAKRKTLYKVLGPLADDKPVDFTLEMNPYRAALVEYCRTKGVLSLMPVSSAEQKSLEERRVVLMGAGAEQPVAFAPPKMEESLEYQGEDDRVDAINRGEMNIGPRDLVRIFNLQTKAPPVEQKPAEKPTRIEQMSGTRRGDPALFNKDGTLYDNSTERLINYTSGYNNRAPVAPPKPLPAPGSAGPASRSGVDFNLPDLQFGMPADKPECKSCKKKTNTSVLP